MTIESAIQYYSGLSRLEKVEFLAQLGSRLTIAARGTYEVGTEKVEAPVRLREFNEIVHRVMGQQMGVLANSASYPDDLFVRFVVEHDDMEMSRSTDWAFADAAKQTALMAKQELALKTA